MKKSITILDDSSTDNEQCSDAVKDIRFAVDSLCLNVDLLIIAGDNVLNFSLVRFVAYMQERNLLRDAL